MLYFISLRDRKWTAALNQSENNKVGINSKSLQSAQQQHNALMGRNQQKSNTYSLCFWTDLVHVTYVVPKPVGVVQQSLVVSSLHVCFHVNWSLFQFISINIV